MSSPGLLLSSQLCFLVYRLDKAIASRYRPLLAELGLTYPQYLAMLALWERDDLSVGELCAILHLDTGTVSPLVKRMEAAGLVERNRSPEDERSVNVRLSDAGRALERRAVGVPGAMAACLLAEPEEYVALKSTLSALVDRVESPSCGPS